MSVCVYTHTYVHTYLPTYPHTYIHTYVHAYICTCIHTYMHTYIHTCMHTYVHAYIRACIHAYMHTYIHTYTHTSVWFNYLIGRFWMWNKCDWCRAFWGCLGLNVLQKRHCKLQSYQSADARRPGQARHTHLRSYRGNLPMQASKAHAFT